MGVVVPGKGIPEAIAQRRVEPLPGEAGRDVFSSPPCAGMMRADSTEANAGTRLKVLSVCQSWFALLRRASR